MTHTTTTSASFPNFRNTLRKEEILFVFGSARGGTTFVSRLLDSCFDVGTGPEGQFVADACAKARAFGDLSVPANRRRYAEYLRTVPMLRIIRERYPHEKRFSVTTDDILDRMTGNEISDGIFAVFKAVADYRKKSLVGNKNPDYWKHLPLLLQLFPDNSRFLFVLRDGRDVALSLQKVPWGGQSAYETATIWKNMIRAVEHFKGAISADRLLTVRYEDLVKEPAEELLRIGHFLGAGDPMGIAASFEKQNDLQAKEDNYEKWKAAMSPRDIRTFEAVAGPELAACKYERVFPDATLRYAGRIQFEIRRLWRLVKLNLYSLGTTLPQGKPEWERSKLHRFLRPGSGKN